MLAKHDRNIANPWNISSHAPYYIFFPVQIALIASIQLCVVSLVVVALSEELGGWRSDDTTGVAIVSLDTALILGCADHPTCWPRS